jgi:hypothetical protein
VFVVGVAQLGLFWKDVRRVLFSDSEYRVLARLNRSGLQEAWTPVKLVDVLRGVVRDFAEIMDSVNRAVLSAMSSAVAAQQDTSQDHRARAAVLEYARMLADRAGIDVSDDELDRGRLLSAEMMQELGVREWRKLLEPVTHFIEQRAGLTFDREVAADYRVAAVTRAGLLEPSPSVVSFEHESAEGHGRFLDSEIVAVYW